MQDARNDDEAKQLGPQHRLLDLRVVHEFFVGHGGCHVPSPWLRGDWAGSTNNLGP